MSRPRSTGRRGALVVLVALTAAGCARGPDNPYPAGTNPPNTGATCDDAAGDLSRVANERGGTLREPAGIDLTHAEARVTDTALRVSFTTAGPVAAAPNPEFRLGQGQAGQLESFELVAAPEGGSWALRLVTFRSDGRGGIQEAPRAVLPVPVRVEGATLSYEVARHDLPRIATYVWLFGASATPDPNADDTVIDDCERMGGGGPATAPGTATTVLGSPTSGDLGDALTHGDGTLVTVYAVEPAPGDPGFRDVAADVKVCAPGAAPREARRDAWSVVAADDRAYPAGDVAAPRQPALPAVLALEPGACRRAWVMIRVPDAATAVAVTYSPDPSGAGSLRWRLP
jgi:hypothetical protein